MLAKMIERETQEGLDLSNGITIEVHTASFRSIRGYAIVAASDGSIVQDARQVSQGGGRPVPEPAGHRYRVRIRRTTHTERP